jgi:hypothetical protein
MLIYTAGTGWTHMQPAPSSTSGPPGPFPRERLTIWLPNSSQITLHRFGMREISTGHELGDNWVEGHEDPSIPLQHTRVFDKRATPAMLGGVAGQYIEVIFQNESHNRHRAIRYLADCSTVETNALIGVRQSGSTSLLLPTVAKVLHYRGFAQRVWANTGIALTEWHPIPSVEFPDLIFEFIGTQEDPRDENWTAHIVRTRGIDKKAALGQTWSAISQAEFNF